MKTEIVNGALRINLVGISDKVEGQCFGEKGKELMDTMWSEIQDHGVRSYGLNHWVYLPENQLFTGVELKEPSNDLGTLELIEVVLPKFLRHVHVGPYSDLPKVWDKLLTQVEHQGEIRVNPSVEIYGHWNEDPSRLGTTILIGLEEKG